MAWAAMCDVYFGVYCLLIAVCYLTARHTRIVLAKDAQPTGTRALKIVDVLLVLVMGLVAFIIVSGGTHLVVGRVTVGLESLYTPMLLATVLLAIRLGLTYRPWLAVYMPPSRRPSAAFMAAVAASSLFLLSPQLYAVGTRLADGGTLHERIFWRSSPPGIDLLALFTPNPNHKLFGQPWRDWLTAQHGSFVENAAALTYVGLLVIAIAVWRYKFRPPRVWVALVVFFAALALGPFVRIAGVNTHIPGPWAILRYVPILSATRSPTRFSIVLMMAFSVLFALAVAHIRDTRRGHGRLVVGLVGVLLAFELAPMPRRAQDALIPDIYHIIASDPRDVRVLGVPFGLSDGERSEGGFNASSQFYQTIHQKSIMGGGMSRISEPQRLRHRRLPVVAALISLSEGGTISDADLALVRRRAPGFVRRQRIGYVVVDSARTPPELRRFVVDVFGLVKIGESGGRELYRPTVGRRNRRPRGRTSTALSPPGPSAEPIRAFQQPSG
jgi:hypothetical protein